MESAYLQFETENPFVDKEDIPNHGDKILSFYFAKYCNEAERKYGYGDSEKENFINQNTNLSNTDLDAISRKISRYSHTSEKLKILSRKRRTPPLHR
ncbi:MAG: hypothetical protein ACLUUO_05560 [Sellimonas intestinalis]